MVKKVVSKFSYHSMSAIFYSLCLIGLTWQVYQISNNHFKYEVLKDVTPIMQGFGEQLPPQFDLCFNNEDIANVSMATKNGLPRVRTPYTWKIGDRFKYTSPVIPGLDTSNLFIVGGDFCHRVKSKKVKFKIVPKVKDFRVSISSDDYDYDPEISQDVSIRLNSTYVALRSVFYYSKRLQSPYVDDCLDGPTLRRSNRLHLCMINMFRGKMRKVSWKSTIRKTDQQYFNYSVMDFFEWKKYHGICQKQNPNPDCSIRYIFTTTTMFSGDPSYQEFEIRESTEPSFKYDSKPRIDDIDFVTYILGALGSWLGFSFIGINPIPLIFQTKSISVNPVKEPDNRIAKRLFALEYDKRSMKRTIGKLVSKIELLEKSLVRMNSNRTKEK